MALELWWGSGSPYSWRALLALEHKRLPYVSHLVQFSKQEHRSPQMLQMNPRGRVPVLKDGDYVVLRVAGHPALPGSQISGAAACSARRRRKRARSRA